MNHREPPHQSAAARRALRWVSLFLLPALTPEGTDALAPARSGHGGPGLHGAELPPYLPVLGAISLRFDEPAPPPDLVTRPAAAAPPMPALTPTESSVAIANAAAAQPAPVARRAAESTPTDLPPPAKESAAAAPAKTPPAILPDDSRPAVRPEDFLPYFEIPGSAKRPGDVSIIAPLAPSAPAPGTLPPSSATYTQTPR
jgi:hypothetical protein